MFAFPLSVFLAQAPATTEIASSQSSLAITQVLGLPAVGYSARVAFTPDPVVKQLVEGFWVAPHPGDVVTSAEGDPKTWAVANVGKNGSFGGDAFNGGYAFCRVASDSDRPMLLHATGDSMVYVNGQPIAGDPYAYGYALFPVELKKGENSFLFSTGRGSLKVELLAPQAKAQFNMDDLTLPDAVIGTSTNDKFGGVIVENCSTSAAKDLSVTATLPGAEPVSTKLPEIAPMSMLKVRFDIPQEEWTKAGEVDLQLTLRAGGNSLDEKTTKFRVRTALQTRKETYISPVDDSVQYYAVVPPPDPHSNMAMLLSLHGAGVEAIGQADAYSPKDWAYVVCATNRRPYGFDWEDWGREDGLDVLRIASKEYRTDPTHTDVTGHSMGGHGTWQFGALFPDKWGAIGVSAGWASFYTYVGSPLAKNPSPMVSLFQRAAATTNTLDLIDNYKSEGVYILHGAVDDNVPVTEARNMKSRLAAIGETVGYHEQPGANHWWSTPLTKGASCLEWPEMMDFLRSHSVTTPKDVDFTTVDLAVSPEYHGIVISEQIHPLEPSRIEISDGDPVEVTTSNIARFYLPNTWNRSSLKIDGDSVYDEGGNYELKEGHWLAGKPGPSAQIGPFKEAFNNHAVLVYGTTGTPEENSWAFAKARYDSESFWYRGNGALKMVSDREYLRSPNRYGNAILYGNADGNAAWGTVMGDSPIQVHNGNVAVGSRVEKGGDLACIFCWRKPGARKLNAAICGTGPVGMRLTDRVPFFISGLGLPDWVVDSPESLTKGVPGLTGAGFYGPKGEIDPADSVWNH